MIAHTDKFSSVILLPRGVRRALDAMRANAGRDWRLGDLAAAAGTSGRTLQRQFRQFLGKTPGAALRDIRFEAARRELLQSLPDARVMDVALRSGLPHYGRFSIEYRRRYGETPSQTLKRQAIFAGVVASMPSFFASSRDRPTIALNPIEASPENREIACGIADELATALARAGFAVATPPRVARYRLSGVIRGWYRQTSLTLRLVEAESGRHLWAHRSDGALGDDSAPGEHLAMRIAASLQPYLRLAEVDRASRKPDGELNARDLTLRAMPGVLSLDAEGNTRALALLEQATDRDPNDALATALSAWARMQRVVYHFTTTPLKERVRAAELARRAQALADDASALAVLGNALTLLHEVETADLMVRKALALDGGSAWAWSRQGWIDVYRGDAEFGHRAVQDRARSRPARFACLQQLRRHRLRAFPGRPLPRRRAMAGTGAARNTRRRPGSIARSVRPMCWAAPSPKPVAALPPCWSAIPSSPFRKCSAACRRCRSPSATAWSAPSMRWACRPRAG